MEEIVVKVEPPDFSDGDTADSVPFNPTSSYFDSIINDTDQQVNDQPQAIEDETLNAFCFESDHPALKNNADYKRLLKAVAILEVQRAQVFKDIDKLHELKAEALADPIKFVERLQQGEKIDFPKPQKINALPEIDWSHYEINSASGPGQRQLTRAKTKATNDILKGNFTGIRGRGHSVDHKQQKPNQYWTVEEQKRLEELLVQFPPEEFESRRWVKIAKCLENRTPIQVASRVQKYFIRLMKAGLPVPGRMPSITYLRKPRRNVIRHQPSTFFASQHLPVYMPEEDDTLNYSYCQSQSLDDNSMDSRADSSDEDELSNELKDSPEFKELMMLKKVRKEKLTAMNQEKTPIYKCCRCMVQPIPGVRWHCTDCKPPASIDFCKNCAQSGYVLELHKPDHRLEEVVDIPSGPVDRDFKNYYGADYNYLDPNYMPPE